MRKSHRRHRCCCRCSRPVMERLLLFSCRQSIHQLSLPNLALNEQHNPCVCAVHTQDKSSRSRFILSLLASLFTLHMLCALHTLRLHLETEEPHRSYTCAELDFYFRIRKSVRASISLPFFGFIPSPLGSIIHSPEPLLEAEHDVC